MRPQWQPKYEVPSLRRWTKKDHESVMFQKCPRCGGRVFWAGDGDTRWSNVLGVRGACFLCPYEVYTKDLLLARPEPKGDDPVARALRLMGAA